MEWNNRFIKTECGETSDKQINSVEQKSSNDRGHLTMKTVRNNCHSSAM